MGALLMQLQQGVMFKNPAHLDRTHSGLLCKISPGDNRRPYLLHDLPGRADTEPVCNRQQIVLRNT